MTGEGLADSEQRARWIREKGMMVLNFMSEVYQDTPVDLLVSEPFDFGEEYGRALVVEVAPYVPLRILCLEALLRMKRDAGRPQDLADIAELRSIHGGPTDG